MSERQALGAVPENRGLSLLSVSARGVIRHWHRVRLSSAATTVRYVGNSELNQAAKLVELTHLAMTDGWKKNVDGLSHSRFA